LADLLALVLRERSCADALGAKIAKVELILRAAQKAVAHAIKATALLTILGRRQLAVVPLWICVGAMMGTPPSAFATVPRAEAVGSTSPVA